MFVNVLNNYHFKLKEDALRVTSHTTLIIHQKSVNHAQKIISITSTAINVQDVHQSLL